MDSSDSESYAGSAEGIYAAQDSAEAHLVDLINNAFDPLPLDRPIVIETQHSGLLNADTQDILSLKEELDSYVKSASEDSQRMQQLIRKIKFNIEWLNSRIGHLERKMKLAIPIEYAQAESKVVFRDDV